MFGQHVYCVGSAGIVVHNRCVVGDLGEHGAKGWLERHGYTDIHSFQNPSGHGIDLFARHRDGTLTFFRSQDFHWTKGPGAIRGSKISRCIYNFTATTRLESWKVVVDNAHSGTTKSRNTSQ